MIGLLASAVLCAAVPTTEPQRVELSHGHCLVSRPAGLGVNDHAPLIVCLHETHTGAAEIIEFWRSLDATLPMVLVAPQGVGPGWRESDLPLLREVVERLIPTLPIDRRRVLLTGHSAGGAMALHLLYEEGFPATAVAVTANYLPPSVLPEHVAMRREVPVLYAVGLEDPNRGPMLEGLELLRANGVNVTALRPPIGHVLDRDVGQQALRWFEQQCRLDVRHALDAVRTALGQSAVLGPAFDKVEDILQSPGTHFPDQVQAARGLRDEATALARAKLDDVRALLAHGQAWEARERLLEIESHFAALPVAEEAAALRATAEVRPEVATRLSAERRADDEAAAEGLWRAAAEALTAADLPATRDHCRNLITLYPHTRWAQQARRVLEQLDRTRPAP